MRVLFTTPILEYPSAGGPFLRVKNCIKALSDISDLYIVSRVSRENVGGSAAEEFFGRYCEKFSYAPNLDLNKKNISFYWLRKLANLIFGRRGFDYSFDDYRLTSHVNFIIKYVKKNNIDLIWFGYGQLSYEIIKGIRNKSPKLQVVCDTDGILSRYIFRGLSYYKTQGKLEEMQMEGARRLKEEKELVALCPITTTVAELDAQHYKAFTKNQDKIKLFSNVIDIDDYQTKDETMFDLKKPNIYLAGYFGPNSPMDNAARWFIDNVFELIKKEIPEMHFYILGRNSKETLADIKDDKITVLGRVEKVIPYLQNADVAIVPIFFESGTRFKILEAAACSVPIVSTALGAEGLPVEHERDILIADKPQDFANAVIKLVKDKKLARRIAQNCKQIVCQNYGLEKLKKEGRQVLNYFKEL